MPHFACITVGQALRIALNVFRLVFPVQICLILFKKNTDVTCLFLPFPLPTFAHLTLTCFNNFVAAVCCCCCNFAWLIYAIFTFFAVERAKRRATKTKNTQNKNNKNVNMQMHSCKFLLVFLFLLGIFIMLKHTCHASWPLCRLLAVG